MISQEQLQQQLTQSLSEVLYLDISQVDTNKTFIDLGLDSIVGVEWLNAINKQYQTAIGASVVYDYPTIKQLASFLYTELADRPDAGVQARPNDGSRPNSGSRPNGGARPNDGSRPANVKTPGAAPVLAPPVKETHGTLRLGPRPVAMAGKSRFPQRREIQFNPKYESKFKDLYFYSADCSGDYKKDGSFSVNYVISPERTICLRDHQVFGTYLLPTDAYIELIYSAARTYFDIEQVCLKNLKFNNPLTGSYDKDNYVRIVFSRHAQGVEFSVVSSDLPGCRNERTHVRGLITSNPGHEKTVSRLAANTNLESACEIGNERLQNLQKEVSVGDFYTSLLHISFGDDFAMGALKVPEHGLHFLLDPTVLFGALTTTMFFGTDQLSKQYEINNDVFIPAAVDNMAINGAIDETDYYCYAEIRQVEKNTVKLYFEIVDQSYHPVVVVDLITLQRLSGKLVRELVSETRPQAGAGQQTGSANSISGAPDNREANTDVAIIGLSCRLPMSEHADAFWENLKNATNCITEVPQHRWKEFRNWYHPDPHHPGTAHNRWGGFVDGIDFFDPLFFGISPSEAEFMDPQQRIFLEECWKTIENAGYAPGSLSELPCGVYVGCAAGDYGKVLAAKGKDTNGAAFLGTSNSILAARIAYHLNLKGPSVAIDTACSSSLTAVHLACESIRNGENSLALAGGIALMTTPGGHILTSQVGMQSKTGRCASFDRSADGTVFSEGCGVVLLKSLTEAIKDNDHILGVIKASGINQDGKTNGITAPSTKSQTRLLTQTYEKYNIDPGRISYVEAHGTGTPLGDPIEISALNAAFRKFSNRENYCAIGSVKSNVGHSSFAAGISGLIKILLCLKHRKLVPSIHYEQANPHIGLDGSPFFVNTQYKDWESDHPRCACINSFGFSGTNAHLVVAEYPAPEEQQAPANIIDRNTHIIPLSAKTADQLEQKATDLLEFIRNRSKQQLSAIAYTLQEGRDSMEYRLGFIVDSAEQLTEKLQSYLNGNKHTPGVYTGRAKHEAADLGALIHDDEIKETIIEKLITNKNPAKLLELWVRGLEIRWNKLYGHKKPRRVELPAYPFARESYWVEEGEAEQSVALPEGQAAAKIHPLLHANVSDLDQQRYQSAFNGEEFFLNDHRVRGKKILPGVAYLEMARAAVEDAVAAWPERGCVELHRTVWLQPLEGKPGQRVFIELSAGEQQVDFEIYSAGADRRLTHCQGYASVAPMPAPQQIAIQDLLGEMTQGELDVETFYSAYAKMGIDYGAGHRAVSALYKGDRSLIAYLKLPGALRAAGNDFILHPSLLDCALQASLGLIADPGQSAAAKPSLPFALEFLRVLSPCTSEMVAWVRYANDSGPGDQVIKLDVDLCDEQGNICVQMQGFSARQLNDDAGEALSQQSPGGLQSLVPVWNALASGRDDSGTLPPSTRILFLGSRQAHADWVKRSFSNTQFLRINPESTPETIQSELDKCSFDQLIWMAPDLGFAEDDPIAVPGEQVAESQELGVLAVFRIVKALLRSNHADKPLQWTIITGRTQAVKNGEEVFPAHAGVAGFTGSMAKEFPHWNIRLLDLDSLTAASAAECLLRHGDKQDSGLALRDGEWFEQGLAVREITPKPNVVYKQKGVYVLIGGAGGLGEVWSRFMIAKYEARIVWIGRREPDAEINEKISRLARIGNAPVYLSADATDYNSLKKAAQQIKTVYPTINGLVHSAIVLQDQSLAHMDEAGFKSSLSAKVDISVNMDRVFGRQDLDFMLFFSSIISFSRSPGQSNYAAGCTFKDSFARRLNLRRPYPVKIVNWGYWGSAGIVGNDAYKTAMEQAGIGSIEPEEGMIALERLVNSDVEQLILLKTLNQQVLEYFNVSQRIIDYPENVLNVLPAADQALNAHDLDKRLTALEDEFANAGMEDLQAQILTATLRSLGFFRNGVVRINDLRTNKKPAPFYDRWLQGTVRYLRKRQWLSDDLRLTTKIGDLKELWTEWEKNKTDWAKNPNLSAQIALLEACLKGLAAILSGERAATDVLFPASSMKLVEGIYKDNVLAELYNEILGETLNGYIREKLDQDPTGEIRILEIGAGTGGTTASLLPRLTGLEDKIKEYCYTDVSKAFLIHAQTHYAPRFAPMTTTLFDVTKPVASQAVAGGAYDVVIAANVLHATPDIRVTLRNAKALLKSGGVLLLNEISNWSLFTHLTFGLLEGWWLNKDTALRIAGSPGINAETWRRLLSEEGFYSVAFPAGDAAKFGQQIIGACSDGVVRQQIDKPAPKEPVPVPPVMETPVMETPVPAPPVTETSVRETPADERQVPAPQAASLREAGISYLQSFVAESLKIKTQRLDPVKPLTEYGLDSILVNQLTTRLRTVFPGITSTLFFEVQTVAGLADYLIENKKEALLQALPAHRIAGSASIPAAPREKKPAPSRRQPVFQMMAGEARLGHPASGRLANRRSPVSDIAIIGLSGRYPQSETLDEFWANLSGGINCITEIPEDRWDWKAYYDPEKGKAGKMYTRWGGFIKDFDKFDPVFFKISPAEAEGMDPQERLFIETCYHAIEDAGYTPENLDETRKIGVFAGMMNSMYSPTPTYFSVSNRVSYLFNFQGPSMTIDTACSSSLTAIHLALESLYSGMSTCAIAGGVNLIVDPLHYLRLTGMNMVSAADRCKAFGAGADGFIDAEGVGAVVLKPLTLAEQDGDHIYGVIKGSAVNAGGKTNGYTVPNPKAQAALVSEALKRAGVNAEEVSYVEAHGTGTALGDPIEISALTRAFKESTDKEQFCSIGSSKSNIGHCESAAGIAALTKVLLQLAHRQLVPSINATENNPEIDFSQTPFKLQENLEEWRRPSRMVNGVVREIPRIAGISSFGAGGANVHMIVQEYQPGAEAEPAGAVRDQPGKVIIPLSARTQEHLRQRAIDLLAYIQAGDDKPVDLVSMAFTLQTGRQAMEERAGFIAGSLPEVAEKLSSFIEQGESAAGVYRDNIKNNKETLALFAGDVDLQEAIEKWIAGRKLPKLLDLWVKGLELDWRKLYSGEKVRRVRLPRYPFARLRIWKDLQRPVVPGSTLPGNGGLGQPAYLHPLVHVNTSTLQEQRFSTRFSGEEFFLTDHQVNGEKILPGVVYLEMARAALDQALDGSNGENTAIQLKNIVWAQPVIMNGHPCSIHIRLLPQESGEVAFEVYTNASGDMDGEKVHSRGIAAHNGRSHQAVLPLADLQKQLNTKQLGAEECYDRFREAGIYYGPAHKGIETLFIGENTAGLTEVLVRVKMPLSVSDSKDRFVLHPSVLDSVLQASIGMGLNGDATAPLLPFAMEHLEVTAPSGESMWAWIRDSGAKSSSPAVQKLDIDLCDDQGKVCVSMKGFSFRPAGAGPAPEQAAKLAGPHGTLLLRPCWREQAAISGEMAEAKVFSRHYVFLCGLKHDSKTLHVPGTEIVFEDLTPRKMAVEKEFQWLAGKLFGRIKAIFEARQPGNILLQVLVPDEGPREVFAGLSGLLKTATIENSRFSGQLIAINEAITAAGLKEKLMENRRLSGDQQVRYRPGGGGQRMIKDFEEIPATRSAPELPWKEGGVYLITGGAGGLGLLFAREIADKTKETTLILTGRSAPGPAITARVREIESAGAKVCYKAVDVTDKKAVNRLFREIRQDFSRLNGVIHSAGIIQDNVILKKTAEEFQSVLAPKVAGTLHIVEAAKKMDPDLLVLFSSGAAVMGNAGQADYATANAFMDAFALRISGQTGSRSIPYVRAINWPQWKDGGMRMDEATEKLLAARMGITAMETRAGMEAFYTALSSEAAEVLVLSGSLQRVRQHYEKPAPLPEAAPVKETLPAADLHNKIEQYVKEQVSQALKINVEDLDADVQLSEFGFDSISLTAFAGTLNQRHKLDLNPTIFFEYPTIERFAAYLNEAHNTVFAEIFAEPGELQEAPAADYRPALTPAAAQLRPKFRFAAPGPVSASRSADRASGALAIVGVSGRFPAAADISEFWDNLLEGKQGIREVPRNRWDWEAAYGDPHREHNKTTIKWGGFIDGIGEFDPQFFGISPEEAPFLDPLHRLLMTHVWSAIEDAGHAPLSLSGTKTGIFIGTGTSGYSDLFEASDAALNGFTPTGVVSSMGPNRMSYFLNLHGPSEPVETACSSSLIAINRAMNAIETGSCDQAIVGGVNIMVSSNGHIAFNKAGLLCEDGVCKTFSGAANGYVRGEGIGVLFLRKLKDAEADRDPIYALIRGGAENHGGRANSLTAPSPKAQSDVIMSAYARAGVDPRTVSYIEAHGTGTLLGDSVEINGLKDAFKTMSEGAGDSPVRDVRCGLGSVKTNIGHLEFASGIAGVIKTLLQLRHKRLVASLNCAELSPYIDLKNSPFYVVRKAETWNAPLDDKGRPHPRRAGVSAFGFGGVNAHVVLEEYLAPASENPAEKPAQDLSEPVAIILSARNSGQLNEYAKKLLDFVNSGASVNLIDLAYTLQVGRDPMQARLALTVCSISELEEKLQTITAGKGELPGVYTGILKQPRTAPAEPRANSEAPSIDTLAKRWVEGQAVDWNSLYGKPRPKRISLPTYPFAKENYWIDTIAGAKPMAAGTSGGPVAKANYLPGDYGAVTEETAAFLKLLVAKQLQVDPGNIDSDDSFFDLGFDSLGIASLVGRLNELLQENMIPSLIFEHRTIHMLAAFLVGSFPAKIDAALMRKPGLPEGPVNTTAAVNPDSVWAKAIHRVPENRNVLVPMQTGGERRPIFAVPGVGGNVLCFQPLSRALGNEQPFYGLQSIGLDGKTLPPDSVEEIAALNITALKTVQSSGPYTLLGYSYGGVIAFEMAKQLLERGEQLTSLLLLDSSSPALQTDDEAARIVYLYKNLAFATGADTVDIDAAELRKMTGSERIGYLYDHTRKYGFDTTREQFELLYTVAMANARSCSEYQPAKLPAGIDVTLFRASERSAGMPDDYGWNNWLRRPLVAHEIAAGHFSIVDNEPILEVAKLILKRYNESDHSNSLRTT